jgi:hypothetical protein
MPRRDHPRTRTCCGGRHGGCAPAIPRRDVRAVEALQAIVGLGPVPQMRRCARAYEDVVTLRGDLAPLDCVELKRLARRDSPQCGIVT